MNYQINDFMVTQITKIFQAALNGDREMAIGYAKIFIERYYNPKATIDILHKFNC
jgi:hypothetical protein